MDYTQLASPEIVEKTVAALKANGMDTHVVQSGAEATQKLIELLPKGASVMTMTSVTLDTIGAAREVNESGAYDSVRNKLMALDPKTQGGQMRALGAAPDWTVGGVHAITEDGHVMIASASGSQLPAYAYGAGNVIWIAGTHKIVKDIEAGFRRIYDYTLPLESERAHQAYGVPGSAVNKLLVINTEMQPGRVTLILVNELLGY